MATFNAATRDQLLTALGSAKGGDTIKLSAANYGSVEITEKFASTVTIQSSTPLAAKFSSINLFGASNVRIDGVHVDNGGNGGVASKLVWIDYGSQGIQLINSEVNGLVDGNFGGHVGVYANASSNIRIENNEIHDAYRGTMSFGIKNLVIVGNNFDRIGEDTMKFASISQALVENNFGSGPFIGGSHLDFVQVQGGASSNMIFRGNVVLPEKYANVQGIFINNDSNTNLLIEDNIVNTSMANGVYVGAGTGVEIFNNTLINMRGKSTFITKPNGSDVKDNIYTKSWQTGLKNEDLVAQTYNDSDPYHIDKYYVKGSKGLGLTISDLAIVKGSLAETMGAFSRIKELLADGGSAPSPGPAPAPTTPPELIYSKLGDTEISGAASVVDLAPASKYQVTAATVAFSFDADTVSGIRGLLTKDAYGYEGGGNHFAAYIKDGALNVMFEGASSRKVFTVGGIKANQEYDLQASFGGGKVSVWLDDKLVGSASFATNWVYNKEYVHIGAHGGWSKTGAVDSQHAFDGTISDVRIAKGAQSLAAMDTLLGSALSLDGAPGSGGEILSEAELEKAMDAAIRYWSEQDVTAKELRALSKVDVLIEDLGGRTLGWTAEQVISIDDDAAGYGWHTGGGVVEKGKVGLLSALAHEYGHVLGYNHDMMGETLGVGERHLPLSDFMTIPSDLL